MSPATQEHRSSRIRLLAASLTLLAIVIGILGYNALQPKDQKPVLRLDISITVLTNWTVNPSGIGAPYFVELDQAELTAYPLLRKWIQEMENSGVEQKKFFVESDDADQAVGIFDALAKKIKEKYSLGAAANTPVFSYRGKYYLYELILPE